MRRRIAHILWRIVAWLIRFAEWLAGIEPEPVTYPVTPWFAPKKIRVKPLNFNRHFIAPQILNLKFKPVKLKLLKLRGLHGVR